MRPTEVKLVERLLETEAEDVTALAKAVITELDADRQKRDTWVIRISLGGETFGMGPYITEGKALAAARKIMPGADDEYLRGAIAKLVRPSFLQERDEEQMSGRYCIECRHPLIAHDWPGERGNYVRRGCMVGYQPKKPDSGCQCGRFIKKAEA